MNIIIDSIMSNHDRSCLRQSATNLNSNRSRSNSSPVATRHERTTVNSFNEMRTSPAKMVSVTRTSSMVQRWHQPNSTDDPSAPSHRRHTTTTSSTSFHFITLLLLLLMALLASPLTIDVAGSNMVAITSSPFNAILSAASLYVGQSYTGSFTLSYFTGVDLILNFPTVGINQYVTCNPSTLKFNSTVNTISFKLSILHTPPGSQYVPISMPVQTSNISSYPEFGGSYSVNFTLAIFNQTNTNCASGSSTSDGFYTIGTTVSTVPTFLNSGANSLDLAGSEWSWSIWVKKNVTNLAVAHGQALFTIGSGGLDYLMVGWLTSSDDRFGVSSSGSTKDTGGTQYSDLDIWTHWCGIGHSNQVTVYRNNVQVLSGSFSTLLATTGGIAIGSRIASTVPDPSYLFVGGSLDELRVWKRAITTTELSSGYTGGKWQEYRQVLYFPFIMPSTTLTAVKDYSGYGRDGTITSTTGWSSSSSLSQVCFPANFTIQPLPSQVLSNESITLTVTPSQGIRSSVGLYIYFYNALSATTIPPYYFTSVSFSVGSMLTSLFTFQAPTDGPLFIYFVLTGVDANSWSQPTPMTSVVSALSGLCASDNGHISGTTSALKIDLSNDQDFSSHDFTLSLWVRIRSPPTATMTALSIGGNSLPNYFALSVDSAGRPFFDQYSQSAVSGTTPITTNTWTLLAGVHSYSSGATGLRLLYLNDGLISSSGFVAEAKLGMVISIGGLYVSSSSTINLWSGSLDDVRIFNRAVTQGELHTLFVHNTISSIGLELFYPFSEQHGPTINDTSGVTSSITSLSSRTLNTSWSDTGDNSLVSWQWESSSPLCSPTIYQPANCPAGFADNGHLVADGVAIDLPLLRTHLPSNIRASSSPTAPVVDFTISVWVMRTALSTSTPQWILGAGFCTSACVSNELLSLGFDMSTNFIFIDYTSNVLHGPSEVQLGVWAHYTFTIRSKNQHGDAEAGRRKIYRNGYVVASDISSTDWTPSTTTVSLAVGGSPFTSNVYFNGKLDELMMFKTQLSDTDVWTAYQTRTYLPFMQSCVVYYPFDDNTTTTGAASFKQPYQDAAFGSTDLLLGKGGYIAPTELTAPVCINASLYINPNLLQNGVDLASLGGQAVIGGSVTLQVHLTTSTSIGSMLTCQLLNVNTGTVVDQEFYTFPPGQDSFSISTTNLYPWNRTTFHSITSTTPWVRGLTFPLPAYAINGSITCTSMNTTFYTVPPTSITFQSVQPAALPIYVGLQNLIGQTPSNLIIAQGQEYIFSALGILNEGGLLIAQVNSTGVVNPNSFAIKNATETSIDAATVGFGQRSITLINDTISFRLTDAATLLPSVLYRVANSTGYYDHYNIQVKRRVLCDMDDGHIVISPGGISPPGGNAAIAHGLPSVDIGVLLQDFSVSVYLRLAPYSLPGAYACAISIGTQMTTDLATASICINSDPSFILSLFNNPSGDNYWSGIGNTVSQWFQLTLTFASSFTSGTGSSLRLMYINGVQSFATYDGPDFVGNSIVTIGGLYDGSNFFVGGIDEVYIFNQVLTPIEVYLSFQSNQWASNIGLQVYLPFKDQNGATITDKSVHGHNFTFLPESQFVWELHGPICANSEGFSGLLSDPSTNSWFYPDCGAGKSDDGSAYFDGSPSQLGNYSNPSDGTGFVMDGLDFTITFWVNRYSYSNDPGGMAVFGLTDNVQYNLLFGFSSTTTHDFGDGWTADQDQNYPSTFYNGSYVSTCAFTSGIPYQWEQWTLTYVSEGQHGAGSPRSYVMYRNGVAVSTFVPARDFQLDQSPTQGPQLWIGGPSPGASNTPLLFFGLIDDFKLYTRWAANSTQALAGFTSGIWSYNSYLQLAYGFYDGDEVTPTTTITDDSGHGRSLVYSHAVSRYETDTPVCLSGYAVLTNLPTMLYVGESFTVNVHFSQQVQINWMDIQVIGQYNNTDITLGLGNSTGNWSGTGLLKFFTPPVARFTPTRRTSLNSNGIYSLVPIPYLPVVLPGSLSTDQIALQMTTPTSGTDFYHYPNQGNQVFYIPVVHELINITFDCFVASASAVTRTYALDTPLNTGMSQPTPFRVNYNVTVTNIDFDHCHMTIDTYDHTSTFVYTISGSSNIVHPGVPVIVPLGSITAGPTQIDLISSTPNREPQRTFKLWHTPDLESFRFRVSNMSHPVAADLIVVTKVPTFNVSVRYYTSMVPFFDSYLSVGFTFLTTGSLSLHATLPNGTTLFIQDPDAPTWTSGTNITSVPVLQLPVGDTTLTMSSTVDIDMVMVITREHDVTNVTMFSAHTNLLNTAYIVNPTPLALEWTGVPTEYFSNGMSGTATVGMTRRLLSITFDTFLASGDDTGLLPTGFNSTLEEYAVPRLNFRESHVQLTVQCSSNLVQAWNEGVTNSSNVTCLTPFMQPLQVGLNTIHLNSSTDTVHPVIHFWRDSPFNLSVTIANQSVPLILNSTFSVFQNGYQYAPIIWLNNATDIVILNVSIIADTGDSVNISSIAVATGHTSSGPYLLNTTGVVGSSHGLSVNLQLVNGTNVIEIDSVRNGIFSFVFQLQTLPTASSSSSTGVASSSSSSTGAAVSSSSSSASPSSSSSSSSSSALPSSSSAISSSSSSGVSSSSSSGISSTTDSSSSTGLSSTQDSSSSSTADSSSSSTADSSSSSADSSSSSGPDSSSVDSSSTSDSSSTGVDSSSSSSSSAISSSSSSSTGPYSSSSTGAVLPPSPTLVVTVPSYIDPCTVHNPCKNGGVCSSARTANTTAATNGDVSVTLSCTCPSNVYGPYCPFTILGCIGCTTNYAGGITVRIVGSGLGYIVSGDVHDSAINPRLSTITLAQADDSVLRILNGLSPDRSFSTSDGIDILTFETPSLINWLNHTQSAVQAYQPSEYLGAQLSTKEFAASVLPSQYEPLSLHLEFESTVNVGTHVPLEVNYTSLLFYTSNTCLNESQFQPDGFGGCTPCPTGGYCPGGGRVWPLPGYWSGSEYQAPIACRYAAACLGSTGPVGANDKAVDTQSCLAGYTGTGCGECATDYYMLDQRCYECGGSTGDQLGQLIAVIIAAICIMTLLSLGVAFLRAPTLALIVTFVVILQEMVEVGSVGAKDLPVGAEKASWVFGALSVINFNVEIVRPGCGSLPPLNFIKLFWITIAMVAITGLMFFAACCARLWYLLRAQRLKRLKMSEEEIAKEILRAKHKLDDERDLMTEYEKQISIHMEVDPWIDFRMRCMHSFLILMTMFYLKLTTLQFKLFQCTEAPDAQSIYDNNPYPTYRLLLTSDMQTPCYTKDHMVTSVMVALLFLCYTFAFPILCYILLVRAFADKDTHGLSGFLWRRFPKVFRDKDLDHHLDRTAIRAKKLKAWRKRKRRMDPPMRKRDLRDDCWDFWHLLGCCCCCCCEPPGYRFKGEADEEDIWTVHKVNLVEEPEGEGIELQQPHKSFESTRHGPLTRVPTESELSTPTTGRAWTANRQPTLVSTASLNNINLRQSNDPTATPLGGVQFSRAKTGLDGFELGTGVVHERDETNDDGEESDSPFTPTENFRPHTRTGYSTSHHHIATKRLSTFGGVVDPHDDVDTPQPGTPQQEPATPQPRSSPHRSPLHSPFHSPLHSPIRSPLRLSSGLVMASGSPSHPQTPKQQPVSASPRLINASPRSSVRGISEPNTPRMNDNTVVRIHPSRSPLPPEDSPIHSPPTSARRQLHYLPPPPPPNPPNIPAPDSFSDEADMTHSIPSPSGIRHVKNHSSIGDELTDMRNIGSPTDGGDELTGGQNSADQSTYTTRPPSVGEHLGATGENYKTKQHTTDHTADDHDDDDDTDDHTPTIVDPSKPQKIWNPPAADPHHPDHDDWLDFRRVAMFGYLFIGLKQDHFPHRLEVFVVNFWFAAVNSLDSDTSSNLFLLGLSFAASCVLVCWHWPFIKRLDNYRVALLNAISLIHVTVMLGIQQGGEKTGWFITLTSIFLLICILVIMRKKLFFVIATLFCPKRIVDEARYEANENGEDFNGPLPRELLGLPPLGPGETEEGEGQEPMNEPSKKQESVSSTSASSTNHHEDANKKKESPPDWVPIQEPPITQPTPTDTATSSTAASASSSSTHHSSDSTESIPTIQLPSTTSECNPAPITDASTEPPKPPNSSRPLPPLLISSLPHANILTVSTRSNRNSASDGMVTEIQEHMKENTKSSSIQLPSVLSPPRSPLARISPRPPMIITASPMIAQITTTPITLSSTITTALPPSDSPSMATPSPAVPVSASPTSSADSSPQVRPLTRRTASMIGSPKNSSSLPAGAAVNAPQRTLSFARKRSHYRGPSSTELPQPEVEQDINDNPLVKAHFAKRQQSVMRKLSNFAGMRAIKFLENTRRLMGQPTTNKLPSSITSLEHEPDLEHSDGDEGQPGENSL